MTTRTDATDEFLVKAGRFFTPGKVSEDLRTVTREGGREGDIFYRDRWSHDKVVRSTHGVNCTGSCSWKVYVKDGVITWGVPADRLPDGRSGLPEYEPRGCPRVPRSPGTPTRRPASGTPTSGRFCSRPTGWPRPSTRTRSTPGPRSSVTRRPARHISGRAARAGWSGPRGPRSTR